MNRWTLTEEIGKKYEPFVRDFINRLEAIDLETATDLLTQDFSDTELNPATLVAILKGLGYEEEDMDDHSWQLDFWITMTKSGSRTIRIEGCGMTFELKLTETN